MYIICTPCVIHICITCTVLHSTTIANIRWAISNTTNTTSREVQGCTWQLMWEWGLCAVGLYFFREVMTQKAYWTLSGCIHDPLSLKGSSQLTDVSTAGESRWQNRLHCLPSRLWESADQAVWVGLQPQNPSTQKFHSPSQATHCYAIIIKL